MEKLNKLIEQLCDMANIQARIDFEEYGVFKIIEGKWENYDVVVGVDIYASFKYKSDAKRYVLQETYGYGFHELSCRITDAKAEIENEWEAAIKRHNTPSNNIIKEKLHTTIGMLSGIQFALVADVVNNRALMELLETIEENLEFVNKGIDYDKE